MRIPPTLNLAPASIGMKNLDLKALATTEYESHVLDFDEYATISAYLSITETGTSGAGACTLSVDLLADEDPTIVLATIDLLTAIVTTNSVVELLVFGRTAPAVKLGTGTLGANVGILRGGLGKCRFRVTVDTANDGDSCVADLRLRAVV